MSDVPGPFDPSQLTMTEIIRLQDLLSKELKRRFERPLVLVFSDAVGSTAYFAQYGDEEGRKLQQRHLDLLAEGLSSTDGRIVDTAGDGAFLVFTDGCRAAAALIAFQERVSRDNAARPRSHQLAVRIGVHAGPVLTDGVAVAGDSVNLAARVAGAAAPGEILLTRAFFQMLDTAGREMCVTAHPAAELKGISRPVELMRLEWRDPGRFPDRVAVRETGDVLPIPQLDAVTFGRLDDSEGVPASDVVLKLPDDRVRRISRWHFELRRLPEGLLLRQLSDQVTEVDGAVVAKGAEAPVRSGTVVRLGGVMTLVFRSSAAQRRDQQGTDFSPLR